VTAVARPIVHWRQFNRCNRETCCDCGTRQTINGTVDYAGRLLTIRTKGGPASLFQITRIVRSMIRRNLGFTIEQGRDRDGDFTHRLIKRHPHDLGSGRGLTIDCIDFATIDAATD